MLFRQTASTLALILMISVAGRKKRRFAIHPLSSQTVRYLIASVLSILVWLGTGFLPTRAAIAAK